MLVYLETNFILAAATGQDPDTAALLATDPSRARLCLPDVCVMEAWYALRAKQKEFNTFRDALGKRIREAQRDLTSATAPAFVADTSRAQHQFGRLFNDIEQRFAHTLDRLAARAEFLPLLPQVVLDSTARRVIDSPPDNLILHVVCEHARRHPAEPRVLLTHNSADFWTAQTRPVLAAAGITTYRPSVRALLPTIA